MKSYTIKMPFTGYTQRTIEAESESEAIDLFFESTEVDVNLDRSNVDEHTWEWTRMVTKGNVSYAVLNDCEIEVEEIDEEEEEEE